MRSTRVRCAASQCNRPSGAAQAARKKVCSALLGCAAQLPKQYAALEPQRQQSSAWRTCRTASGLPLDRRCASRAFACLTSFSACVLCASATERSCCVSFALLIARCCSFIGAANILRAGQPSMHLDACIRRAAWPGSAASTRSNALPSCQVQQTYSEYNISRCDEPHDTACGLCHSVAELAVPQRMDWSTGRPMCTRKRS